MCLFRLPTTCVSLTLAACFFTSVADRPAWGQPEAFRVVAVSGTPAPGTNSWFSGFHSRALEFNDLGHVAFSASLQSIDPVAGYLNGAWVDRGNGLEHIASTHRVLSGTGSVIDWVSQVVLNDAGDVAISARLADESEAIFSENDTGFLPVASTSQIAPGTDVPYWDFVRLEFTNDRHVLFSAELETVPRPPVRDAGIWTNETGVLTPIAFSGQNLANGEVITGIDSLWGIATNRSGHAAFMTESTRPGNEGVVSSVWKYLAGNLSRIVQTGDEAPGTDSAFQGLVRSPGMGINQTGHIAFPFSTNESGRATGIWKETADGLADVALVDDPVSDTDATVYSIWDPLQITAGGDVAFTGRVAPGTQLANSDTAAMVEIDDELTIVVREGQPMPGVDDAFGESAATSVQLNDLGMFAFRARISGLGTYGLVSNSLWVDKRGTPEIVLRAGDAIEIGLNDVRIVEAVREFELNNIGQIAVNTYFTDGTKAVLVSRSFAVPEPSAVMIVALFSGMVLMVARNAPPARHWLRQC